MSEYGLIPSIYLASQFHSRFYLAMKLFSSKSFKLKKGSWGLHQGLVMPCCRLLSFKLLYLLFIVFKLGDRPSTWLQPYALEPYAEICGTEDNVMSQIHCYIWFLHLMLLGALSSIFICNFSMQKHVSLIMTHFQVLSNPIYWTTKLLAHKRGTGKLDRKQESLCSCCPLQSF